MVSSEDWFVFWLHQFPARKRPQLGMRVMNRQSVGDWRTHVTMQCARGHSASLVNKRKNAEITENLTGLPRQVTMV